MQKNIGEILAALKNNSINSEHAEAEISKLYACDLGFAQLDINRKERTGYPEVVFCAGKTFDHNVAIIQKLYEQNGSVFCTKADCKLAEKIKSLYNNTVYDSDAKTLCVGHLFSAVQRKGLVVVAAAGTSDLKAAKEAYCTAEYFGSNVKLICDIGVAGIHRLFAHLDEIRQSRVIIAAAGMEGALAGVLAGLVSVPVIALPTSVGYGAAFGGVSALLGMLTSCAPGISVVNIDNGFGAGYQANLINRLAYN
ncbi:MAG: nickel pincer cofactor biosynthesis protein LarB [Termitinemataceae bacterium]|nr:MAG: nickel pincer cofactor biosynthesis protein LarB [Termitinemataceae bacterium]